MRLGPLAFTAGAVLFGMVSASHANLIVNGDFESPALNSHPSPTFGPTSYQPYSNYVYPGLTGAATVASWTYTGGSGLIDTSQGFNYWYGNTSPSGFSGVQYAFVQGTGTLSQAFNSLGGLTTISWLEGSRPNLGSVNGNETYQVLLNGNAIYTNTTPNGQNFLAISTVGTLLAGLNTLEFVGLSQRDSTVFLDDVAVAAVPEASTWIMMVLGFAGLGLITYRRQQSALALAAR
jgi:hypothetical protein